MRVMRVLSLVAGIALLVTGLASTVGRRADVAEARDQRLETSAELLTEQLDAAITRATAAARACTSEIERLAPQASVDAAAVAARGQPAPVVVAVPDSLRAVVAL